MPWLLGTSGTTERVCPESEGLEDDDDDNYDEFSYPCYSARPPRQRKSYNSLGGSQLEDLGEPIPFSLNPRYSYVVKDEGANNRIYAETLAKHALELEEDAQGFQEPLYKGTEIPGSLAKDEDHSWAHHLPVHQNSHVLGTARMAPCGSYDPFQGSVGKRLGMDVFGPWAPASDPYLGHPEPSGEADPHMPHEEAIGDGEFPSLPPTYGMLKEENAMLRRVVRSMQSSMESQALTVQKLERQLKASLAKEEREAQELQSFVQRTEWSLHLTTQRALEAESKVEKLKEEIFILRGELESSKAENENLRASQTTDLGAVKHILDFALQSLHKIITGTNWSIKQLASGVESLHIVAEVLKSAGKISEVEAEKKL